MQKNFFTMVLVVVVGILVGLVVVKRQTENPLLKELVNQQDRILNSQKTIEAKLASSGGGDQNVSNLVVKQQLLEARIAALEAKIISLQNAPVAPQPQEFQGPPPEDFSKVYEIPLDHTPIIGKKGAPVTIQEFVDFQCPFCARFHPPVVEVLKAYPDKVNYVVKNFPLPFHPMAKPAAKAAFAANEQGKYMEMVDAILEDNSSLSEDKLKELAKKIGLNVDKFMKDLKDNDAKYEDWIKKDMDLARQVAVMGTPTFYINGRKTNARDFASYKAEIDKILSGEAN